MIHPLNGNRTQRIGIILLAIFLGSLVFQGLITFLLFPTEIFSIYQLAAQQHLDQELDRERLVDFSPLYFYVHVIARKFLPNPSVIIIWVQLLLSACSAVCVFLILRTLFPLPFALIGTITYITNRSVLLYVGAFVPEAFMIFFLLGFLLFTLRPTPTHSLLAGISLSLSLLTRSNLFPLAVITPIYYWLNRRPEQPFPRRILLFELPILIAVVLLIGRNSSVTGEFTPFSMNPGTVFFEGNNPNSYGEAGIYPPLVNDLKNDFTHSPDFQHVAYRMFARRIADKPLSIPEVNTYWMQKATNFLRDYPWHAVTLYLTKLHSFFHSYRKHDLSVIHWNDQRLQHAWIPTVPFALLSALAIPGIFLSLSDWKRRLLLYMVFFAQFGIMMLTYILDRQRVAIIALMIIFASETVHRLIVTPRLKWISIGIAALIPIFWFNTDIMHDDAYTWKRYAMSGRYLDEARTDRTAGNLRQAAEKNALALALTPGLPDSTRLAELKFAPQSFEAHALEIARSFSEDSASAQFDLAILYLENDYPDEAEVIFQQLIDARHTLNRQHRQSSQPYFYLALAALHNNEPSQAVDFLKSGLKRNPGDPWALAHLFALTEDVLYKDLLFRYFDEIDAEFLLGQAYLHTRQPKQAVASFAYVIEKLPEYRKGRLYYSIALGQAKHYDQATQQYLEALRKKHEPIFYEADVLHMFRIWAEQNSEMPEAKYYLAVILREFGHYQEALEIQRKLLEMYPTRDEIQTNIDWLENAINQYNRK